MEGSEGKNPRSGRKMSDAIFVAEKTSGPLKIGDKGEIDKAVWAQAAWHSADAHLALCEGQALS